MQSNDLRRRGCQLEVWRHRLHSPVHRQYPDSGELNRHENPKAVVMSTLSRMKKHLRRASDAQPKRAGDAQATRRRRAGDRAGEAAERSHRIRWSIRKRIWTCVRVSGIGQAPSGAWTVVETARFYKQPKRGEKPALKVQHHWQKDTSTWSEAEPIPYES